MLGDKAIQLRQENVIMNCSGICSKHQFFMLRFVKDDAHVVSNELKISVAAIVAGKEAILMQGVEG